MKKYKRVIVIRTQMRLFSRFATKSYTNLCSFFCSSSCLSFVISCCYSIGDRLIFFVYDVRLLKKSKFVQLFISITISSSTTDTGFCTRTTPLIRVRTSVVDPSGLRNNFFECFAYYFSRRIIFWVVAAAKTVFRAAV